MIPKFWRGSQKAIIMQGILDRGNSVDTPRMTPMLKAVLPGRTGSTHRTVLNRLIDAGLVVRQYTVTEKGKQLMATALDARPAASTNRNKR